MKWEYEYKEGVQQCLARRYIERRVYKDTKLKCNYNK